MTERMKAQLGGTYDYPNDMSMTNAEYMASLAGSTSPKEGELVATAIKGKQVAKMKEAEQYRGDTLAKVPVRSPSKAPNTLPGVRASGGKASPPSLLGKK